MKIFKYLVFLLVFVSCLKTAEQINQEKQTSVRAQQSQKMLADLMVKTKTLEEQVSQMQGNIQVMSASGQNQAAFKKDSVDELRVQMEEQARKIKKIEKELKGQNKFIKNVNATLKKLSKALLK